METQKTAETVKAIAIPDKKSLDRFGNPTKWILKVIEPRELYGLIAFPEGFEVKPGVYVVDIIRRGKNYAVVKLYEHVWIEYKRDENPYTTKVVFQCVKCGAWDIEYIQKFGLPLVEGWKNRWYIHYAVEMRRRSDEVVRSASPPLYYYIAVRNADAAEKLFYTMKSGKEVCELHEVKIYDDEAGKTRTVDAWRGASDKSWVCSRYPPLGYVPAFGWVDVESFKQYEEAKAEAERLWKLSEEILEQKIDIGQCIPDSRGACRRYASRLASFL